MTENRSDTASPAETSEAEKIIAETLQLAISCQRSDRLADAEALYRSILDFQPRHAAANHGLGLLLMQAGKLDAALEYLTNACAVAPETGRHWIGVADCLLRLDRPQETLQVLETAIQAGLKDAEADALLARARQVHPADACENPGTPVSREMPGPPSSGETLDTAQVQELQALVRKSIQRAAIRRNTRTEASPALGPLLAANDWPVLEAAVLEALRSHPERGKDWDLLSVTYLHQRRYSLARLAANRASELLPKDAEVWDHLGYALLSLSRTKAAEKCFHKSLAINPLRAETWINLGMLQQTQDRVTDALASFLKGAQLKPELPEAYSNLGSAYWKLGETRKALASCRKALALNPGIAEAYVNLGNALMDMGNIAESITSYRLALAIKPHLAEAHSCLGNALRLDGQGNDAVSHCLLALELQPDSAVCQTNLGYALNSVGRKKEAIVVLQQSLTRNPDDADTLYALGNALCERNLSEGIDLVRRALALKPDLTHAHTLLLFALSHDELATPEAVSEAHRAFGRLIEAPLREKRQPHANIKDPDRRLRVGFVSADLRHHAVHTFIEPVWAQLDRRQVEIWAYSNHFEEDFVTERLKKLAHHWRKVVSMSDAFLAETIRDDQIDILVDLSGHTTGHRLNTFALKPAPVQASWIGYPNTTGLEAMDYYIADSHLAPPGLLDSQFTEKFLRLPCTAVYRTPDQELDISPLPALQNGWLTFASFARISKFGDKVLDLWCDVLRAIPDSRMLLIGDSENPDQRSDAERRLWSRFAQRGIPIERILFQPRIPIEAYLASHARVDMILDTFPYGGGTTTYHAAWMGVPVLTLAGETMPSRQGATIAGHLGLQDFIVQSPDQFVEAAVHWSHHLAELAEIRGGLRKRMLASLLTQPDGVARGLEKAFRAIWRRWCTGLAPDHIEITP
ncbi:MAG: tetratricopeptide repeat protein [Rhodocyclaceae bacterium]|nr:tetratricopeptide repeat protein [Rhodocyclaceae bacterium]